MSKRKLKAAKEQNSIQENEDLFDNISRSDVIEEKTSKKMKSGKSAATTLKNELPVVPKPFKNKQRTLVVCSRGSINYSSINLIFKRVNIKVSSFSERYEKITSTS
jgi:hypothetical protein